MQEAILLTVAGVIEAATGIGLVLAPGLVATLLLGVTLPESGAVVARVAGITLVALSVACVLARGSGDKFPVLAAMLTYNVLIPILLAFLGIEGKYVGVLLWPAVVVHAALAVLFVRACLRSQAGLAPPAL